MLQLAPGGIDLGSRHIEWIKLRTVKRKMLIASLVVVLIGLLGGAVVLLYVENEIMTKRLKYAEQLLSKQGEMLTSLSQENHELYERQKELEETIRLAALTGTHRPDDVRRVAIASTALANNEWQYVGVWEGTAYNAVPEQTDSDPTHTASSTKVAPGYTIAVDPSHWPFGTQFYIDGIGLVCAEDSGGKVKGPNRFDYLVSDRDFALALGRWKAKVWAIDRDEPCLND